MEKWGECAVAVRVDARVVPRRVIGAQATLSVRASQASSAGEAPITIIVKGSNLERVIQLASLMREPDARIAELIQKSSLAQEGETPEQSAKRVRELALNELLSLAEGDGSQAG